MRLRQQLIDAATAEEEARLLADHGTVRVVGSGERWTMAQYADEQDSESEPPEDRTPMQKTQDEIFDNADKDAIIALETATSSLAWLELLVELPKDLRHGLPQLLDALQVLIHEERRLRL